MKHFIALLYLVVVTLGASVAQEIEQTESKEELKAYSKFDFVPGEKVIFFDDFSLDNVGDFPSLWNTNASGEVVTLNTESGKWVRLANEGIFIPEIKGKFGENFTVEFDLLYAPKVEVDEPEAQIDFISTIKGESPDNLVPGNGGCAFKFGAHGYSVFNWAEQQYGDISNNKESDFLLNNKNQKVHVSFSVQKQRVRFWINEEKIFDVPRLLATGLAIDRIRFNTWQDDVSPYLYLANLRVASGQPDLRNKLMTDGKLVTRGILFDVNSDKIQAESYGTLKEIANVLKENGTVRVKIVGHTDGDGTDVANLELSKRRAASVKNSLNREFGIDASRMETDGKGESQPTDKNDTPEGRANNRRVEFLKL